MAWWRRKQMEERLDKELSFHLDEHAKELIARGRAPEQARREARLALGGPEQVKEQCRDVRGTRWLEDLIQDVRYSLRALRQKPGFSLVILSTLALGIGAATVMFTLINGVLLKPLPYPEPNRLLTLQEKTQQPTQFGDLWFFGYPNYLDCRSESRTMTMAAWRPAGGTLSEPGDPAYIDARQISAGLFSVLRVALIQGREFLPEEDRSGAAPVAVISQALWQRRFGSSPAAIGATLVFDGNRYRIVGVAPARFRVGGQDADLYTPLGQDPSPVMQSRNAHPGVRVLARLNPGIKETESKAELALIGANLAKQYPASNQGHTFIADLLQPYTGGVGPTLWLLLGAVAVVLLIACGNVASLLLARAHSREKELALRVALGARRGRLIRQCLTESAVLGLAGGIFGVALAALGTQPFLLFWPGSLPRAEEVALDGRVLGFALALSLLCGLAIRPRARPARPEPRHPQRHGKFTPSARRIRDVGNRAGRGPAGLGRNVGEYVAAVILARSRREHSQRAHHAHGAIAKSALKSGSDPPGVGRHSRSRPARSGSRVRCHGGHGPDARRQQSARLLGFRRARAAQ